MRPLLRILQASLALAFALALIATSASAVTRVKGASNYGPTDPSFDDCRMMKTEPCQADQLWTEAPTTLDGGVTVLNAYQFTDGSGDVFDIFDLGTNPFAGGNTISMGTTPLGVFACGDFTGPSNFAFDSGGPGSPTGLPCSPIAPIDNPTIGSQISTVDANSNPFDFTLNSNGSITFGVTSGDEIVVFDEQATPTPEPATLSLFGLGLIALAGLLVRRAA